ncbi:phosphoribosylaminoimidazole-succinocarboxamide synthase [Physcia stellaris]|nr:phosphoribosylaminoimidazole-succinocarboxamide synthase [Physcia stellaris]
MSGTSNVGGPGVYEASDQRTEKNSEINERDRYKEGKENSHQANDSKDERSIANKLARESERSDQPKQISKEAKESQKDPTLPARNHGNEPSKGAKIDAELQQEEEEILKKKGAWGSKQ